MRGNAKWGAAGLILGLAVALSIPSSAQTTTPAPGSDEPDRTVTVSGSATIRSAPDEAVVTFGVRTQAATAEEAMQQNAKQMSEVVAVLLDEGLREDDIATAWINLYPNYSDSGLTIVGYSAENQVSATIREMGKVGRIVDRVVGAGANTMSGITFQLSDENKGLDQALQAAVADARRKADVLAAAAGADLGQVLLITETSAPTPGPFYRDVMYAGAEAASTPVLPPTLETQVTVTVVWALA